MAIPPKIGQTFARAKAEQKKSSSTKSNSTNLTGGFSDIRGATGFSPPPSTPFPTKKEQAAKASLVDRGSVSSSSRTSSSRSSTVLTQKPITPTKTEQQARASLIDRGESNISLTRAERPPSSISPSQRTLVTPPEVNNRFLQPTRTQVTKVDKSVGRGTYSYYKEPGNVLEEVAANTIFAGFFGLESRLDERIAAREAKIEKEQEALRSRGATEQQKRNVRARITSEENRERLTSGLVMGGVAVKGGALAVKAASPVAFKFLNPIASRVEKAIIPITSGIKNPVVKDAATRATTIGVGGALQTIGAFSSDVGLDVAASSSSSDLGFSPSSTRTITQEALKKTIGKSLVGSEIVDEKGTVIQTKGPEFGEGLMGEGQRFILSNVPGVVSFVAPDITRQSAIDTLKEAGVSNPTNLQIESLIKSQQIAGGASTFGLVLSEGGSELVAAGILGRGSPKLQSAKTSGAQSKELLKTVVPATFVAGIGEGGTQTYNVQQLTGKANVLDVASSAVLGGVTAGTFGFLTSVATPRGKGKVVNFVGNVIDAPGETLGDFAGNLIRKPFGKSVSGIKIPIFTPGFSSGFTPTKTASKTTKKTRDNNLTRTGLFSNIFNISGSKTDEFGLPVAGNTNPFTGLPSNTTTSVITDTFSSTGSSISASAQPNTLLKSDSFTEVFINSNTASNAPSLATVGVIIPAGGPGALPFALLPPGGEGGRGKGKRRVKYFNELTAAFSSFSNALRAPNFRTRRTNKRSRNRR